MEGTPRIGIDDLPIELLVEIVLAGDERSRELVDQLCAMASEARERCPQSWAIHFAAAYRQADRTLYAEQVLTELRGQLFQN